MKHSRFLFWGVVLAIFALITGVWPLGHAVWAQGNTWHVATDGSDVTGDGSQAKPFATIQHGIDVASHGDTVLVHPGTYMENINFNGKNITVASLFHTTGDEGYISQTVIDGNHRDRAVTFSNGEDATAVLRGLTITGGHAHGVHPYSSGGGIGCFDSGPTIEDVVVTGNTADSEGGGIYSVINVGVNHESPRLRNAIVTNNTAIGGGGIRTSYGSPIIENVIVSGNAAIKSPLGNGVGGGIQLYHTDVSLKNMLIANNVASDKGGGLQFDGCSPALINVTIVGNSSASGEGGGLNVSYESQPSLVNSIVWGNSPQQIYYDPDWWGEAITVAYSDIQGGEAGIDTNGQGPVYWGDGNLDANPLFVDGNHADYHLADDSPCIGAGTSDHAPSADIEGNPRPNPAGSNPDLGAYESPLGAPTSNRPPTADAGGPYHVDEGGSVVVTASASDPDDDPLTFAWDLDNDGTFETPGQSAQFSAAGLDGPSSRTITVQATDSGGLAAGDLATVEVLNVAPTPGAISAPQDPVKVGAQVNVQADFTDPGVLDSHSALWEWGDGGSSVGAINETNGSGWVTGSHAYSRPGLYTLNLTVTDKDGGIGQPSYRFAVVYDPRGGFVTGGGWIDSPPGACSFGKCRSDTSGKASFGFIAKYKKGARVPSGVTGFQFRAGKLNFHSSRYDWLVVTGAKAMLKGTGKINGTGRYAFLVSVIDAGISPDDSLKRDRFRIRIWDTKGTQDEGDDVVVYDNQVCGDTGLDADPCAEIKHGSIVIHEK